jgi:hypothetical protein
MMLIMFNAILPLLRKYHGAPMLVSR